METWYQCGLILLLQGNILGEVLQITGKRGKFIMTQVIRRRVCPHALSQRLFLLCAATYIIGLFGRLSYSAVMVDLISSGSMDKTQAGLVGTALFIVYGVCQIFSGLIGDQIGRAHV